MGLYVKGRVAHFVPAFGFTTAQLEEMLTMQKEANDVMAGDWQLQGNDTLPFYRAAHIEATEAIQHIGFKWWKKIVPAVTQAEMELIDILHFVLSDMLRHCLNDPKTAAESIAHRTRNVELWSIGAHANNKFDGNSFERKDTGDILDGDRIVCTDLLEFSFNDLAEQFISRAILHGRSDIGLMYCLFERMETTPAKAHALYVSKNVLNKFRTANGQIEGTYHKIWDGREDNDHLSDYVEQQLAEGSEITVSSIQDFLTLRYFHTFQSQSV